MTGAGPSVGPVADDGAGHGRSRPHRRCRDRGVRGIDHRPCHQHDDDAVDDLHERFGSGLVVVRLVLRAQRGRWLESDDLERFLTSGEAGRSSGSATLVR